MRKKYSKQKEAKIVKQRKCSLCLLKAVTSNIESIPIANLKKKYYYPQIQTYHYRSASNLIYDPYSRESIELSETNKLLISDEMLTRYNSFSETVQQIKLVIHRRVEKDFYGWVDFHDEHYAITNNYYIRRKHLVQNNKKMQKYLKNTHSMQSTGSGEDKIVREYFENKIKKELDNQRLVKLSQNDTNSSTIDLQKLTRNLEHMICKIADLSVIRPYNTQYTVTQRKKTHNNISLLFKMNSCQDISAIDKNQEDLIAIAPPPQFDPPNKYQESYGLDTIKPKNHNKGKKLNKLSLRSMDKINGFEDRPFPETPKPRFFHGDNEYEEPEFNNPGTWGKSNQLSRKKLHSPTSPMSPGNNHSSSLKNSKTLSKNGSQSSVRKAK